jgi:hypothetical protein
MSAAAPLPSESDDELTPEKVIDKLRRTRLEQPTPKIELDTADEETKVIDIRERLSSSDELTPEKVKAMLAQTRQAAQKNASSSGAVARFDPQKTASLRNRTHRHSK